MILLFTFFKEKGRENYRHTETIKFFVQSLNGGTLLGFFCYCGIVNILCK